MERKDLGAWHLANNPQLYEVQRNNNFEFVVTGLEDLLRAGATGNEKDAYITNAQEVLRVSVNKATVPHFTQEPIQIKRGNTTIKYAGVPQFGEGQLSFNDYIGADTLSVLMAWQNQSCDIGSERVGSLMRTNYKKLCYLIEYPPDYDAPVRTWKLYGCWISSLSEGEFTMDNGDKHMIDCVIQYDRAELDLSDAN